MNADAFRQFFDYHFAENRKIWDSYIAQLTEEQFRRDPDYSRGSIRDQILHLMSADNYWFSGLRGIQRPADLSPADFDDRKMIRARWDEIEQTMRAYLSNLQDETLFEKPFRDGEDPDLLTWQALLQVANHGTDHRAQILRLLHDLGIKTSSQDYIFYIYRDV